MSENWFKWAKITYSIPLSVTGLVYLLYPQGTVESLVSFIPGGLSLIYGGGILWLVLGLLIALDIQTRYASYGVIILLSIYFMMVHIPALTTGEHLNIVIFELLRNLSLMGGAFFILGLEASKPSAVKQEESWHSQ